MAEAAVVEIVDRELSEHPAAVAWRRVAPEYGTPRRIAVLKNHAHSKVYRLEGAGPQGTAVVAKHCRAAGAEIERAVYEDIFPALEVAALHFYGILRDNGERASREACWLFLEDASGENYSYALYEHRALAGRWLGAMHCFAAQSRISTPLPNRGPGYYLEILHAVRAVIQRSFVNPSMNAENLRVLDTVLAQYDTLESRWSHIGELCDCLPLTLVHGDLAAKNVRVLAKRHGLSLVVLDWETAGWGVPAADLAQYAVHSLSPDLDSYSAAALRHRADRTHLARLAKIGNTFRLLTAASWITDGLSSPWVERSMRKMRHYQSAMAACLRDLGWGI